MAFIQRIQFSEELEGDVFMVTDSVGANGANWWTDIQLVQYLIGSIYIFANDGGCEWSQLMTQAEINNLPDPHVEFKSLTKTTNLIKRFQDDAIKQGEKVFADGRVDRAKGLTSSISKTHYTILVANYYFSNAVITTQGAEDPIQWALDDPDMPTMLKGQLQTHVEV
jgi:hypothetical protein